MELQNGTLYYHFSSKEEIFNFLVEEGMKLLKNSIEIKTSKLSDNIEKLKAIMLIEIKVIVKYENIISIILSQIWGNESRNLVCRKYVIEYIDIIKNVICKGIENREIIDCNPELLSYNIFNITSSTLIYKLNNNTNINIHELYSEFVNTIIYGLKKK